MDPLTAVSLASSVVQFVDFSLKVVSKGFSLKRSSDGVLKEHRELKTVIEDLVRLEPSSIACNDDNLRVLIEACQEVSRALREALQKVQRRGSRNVWTTFRTALLLVWKKEDLEEMEKRLDRLRDQIVLHLQLALHQDLKTLTNRQNLDFGEFRRSLTHLSTMLQDTTVARSTTVEANRKVDDLVVICEKLIQPNVSAVDTASHQVTNQPTASEFLDTLTFRRMDEREDSIPAAHIRTFEWILSISKQVTTDKKQAKATRRDESARAELRQSITEKLTLSKLPQSDIRDLISKEGQGSEEDRSLVDWLTSGNGIFWISGKPGCGKSTLMKALMHNKKLYRRLIDLLHQWSTEQQPLIAKFFFFRPGTELQKSHLGLLMSLLSQLLTQDQSLIDVCFAAKEQREAVARSATIEGTDEAPWAIHELMTAFKKLKNLPRAKIFLHIDGIDEMIGSSKDTARILYDLSLLPNTKILVAGRWTPDFEETFALEQTMPIHDKTSLDILWYCIDKLTSKKFISLLNNPRDLLLTLKDIMRAAEGVFLWVYLVLESLSESVSHYEDFKDFLARIKEYPQDLDDLYAYLFINLDSRFSAQAAFWLSMAAHNIQHRQHLSYRERFSSRLKPWEQPLRIFDVIDAEQYDANGDTSLVEMYRLQRDKATEQSDALRAENRMRSRCLHMFDFRPKNEVNKRVEVMHRTLYDFLKQKKITTELQKRTLHHADPLAAYYANLIVKSMKSTNNKSIATGRVLRCLRQAEVHHDDFQFSSLQKLWAQTINAIPICVPKWLAEDSKAVDILEMQSKRWKSDCIYQVKILYGNNFQSVRLHDLFDQLQPHPPIYQRLLLAVQPFSEKSKTRDAMEGFQRAQFYANLKELEQQRQNGLLASPDNEAELLINYFLACPQWCEEVCLSHYANSAPISTRATNMILEWLCSLPWHSYVSGLGNPVFECYRLLRVLQNVGADLSIHCDRPRYGSLCEPAPLEHHLELLQIPLQSFLKEADDFSKSVDVRFRKGLADHHMMRCFERLNFYPPRVLDGIPPNLSSTKELVILWIGRWSAEMRRFMPNMDLEVLVESFHSWLQQSIKNGFQGGSLNARWMELLAPLKGLDKAVEYLKSIRGADDSDDDD